MKLTLTDSLPFPARDIAHVWQEDRNPLVPHLIREALRMEAGQAMQLHLRDLMDNEPQPGPMGFAPTWAEYKLLSVGDRLRLRFEQAGLRLDYSGEADRYVCYAPDPARP